MHGAAGAEAPGKARGIEKQLLSIAGATDSEFTLANFESRGEAHGFIWWLDADHKSGHHCKSARILDTHGYRGWEEFRIAECVDAGAEFSGSAGKGKVYVIASGRMD